MPPGPPSIDELRRVCQPPRIVDRRSEEHWTGRLYMRRLSLHVTRLAIRRNLTADAVTALMMGVGVVGAAVLALGGWWPAVVTAVAIHLFVLLDASDGEVARWNRSESARGIYLDRVAHYAVDATLLAALGWRAGGGALEGIWLPLGLAAAIGAMFGRLETDLVDAARAKAGLPARGDTGATIGPRPLRTMRRLADFVPIHRATGAVEISLLAVVAATIDAGRADLVATRWLVSGLVGLVWIMAGAHLASVLLSERLAPTAAGEADPGPQEGPPTAGTGRPASA